MEEGLAVNYLQKCQHNIYSDEPPDSSEEEFDFMFKGKYQDFKQLNLEKFIKDDFNVFNTVKFENEGEQTIVNENEVEEDDIINEKKA